MKGQVNIFGEVEKKDPLLRDKFIEPPFSILDTKSGSWQRRKRLWKSIGMKSEVGRDAAVITLSSKANVGEDYVSIFDPALCEVLYHWFCPEGGSILDPFAGGSVRGIVANYLGYKYTGIDIRQEQIDSNTEQGLDILGGDNLPNWIVGDSNKVLDDITSDLTPFEVDSKGTYLKREDYASYTNDNESSGTKVRAFNNMIDNDKEGEYLAIGCSADSLMQVYVAESAKRHNLKSKIFIPSRKKISKATEYSYNIGGNIEELPYPCYPAHYKKALREFSEGKKVVKWDSILSTRDTATQVYNLPEGVKRIVVPTGSGAIATGIIAGLVMNNRLDVEVICVKVSTAFGGKEEIIEKVKEFLNDNYIKDYKGDLPSITIIPPTTNYSKEINLSLEDGSELDPGYSAKAYLWLLENPKNGSCLWISGRRPGLKLNKKTSEKYDFLFSCPPYADLEVYSKLEGDISNMDYKDFMEAYESIIDKSAKLLKPGGYACFVVGEVRDKKGNYIGFVPDTIRAFEKAGLRYYNEAILLNAIASASLRAGVNMRSKKLVKIHQNVLIFKKE